MPQSAAEANSLMEGQHGFNSSNGDPEEWTPTATTEGEDDDLYDDNDYCDDCGDFLGDDAVDGLCPTCNEERLSVDDHSNGVSV
jgi:hypothetical protein